VLTDLLERELGEVPSDGPELGLQFEPFEIKTVKLERHRP
jgi:hypothetical protein